MKLIYIRTCTSIEDACKQVVEESEKCNDRVVADFNGYIIDSKKSVEKNLEDFEHYMQHWEDGINWEQRRFDLAKDLFLQGIKSKSNRIISSISYECHKELANSYKDNMAKNAVEFADALIQAYKNK